MIEGSLDMLKVYVGLNCNLVDAKISQTLVLKDSKIKGKLDLEGAKYKELIK
ncbi:hypothetical protein FJ208_02075 [Candidatus Gribaldobacteria bacterium]|nr:hypothetical protein [Candidatus Gribaldobacteria bacterium]